MTKLSRIAWRPKEYSINGTNLLLPYPKTAKVRPGFARSKLMQNMSRSMLKEVLRKSLLSH